MASASFRRAALLVLLTTAAACGGSDVTPGTTTPGTTPPAATVTITSAGASPKTITVSPGSQVAFVNNDSVSHQMYSDPHPEHTDCPELDQVGFLAPGQQRQSGNLNTVRTCGFHDHGDPLNATLKGNIVIR